MNEKTYKKILEEKEKKTGELDLGYCDLQEIPAILLEMDWLIELNLGQNQIKEIKNLQNLTKLAKTAII